LERFKLRIMKEIEITHVLVNALGGGYRWRPTNLSAKSFFKIELAQRGTDSTEEELDRLDTLRGFQSETDYKNRRAFPLLGKYNDGIVSPIKKDVKKLW
jgi:hypothetical protein